MRLNLHENRRPDFTVLDLFSGIGGFSLGLERAGMRTIAFCEIEEYPRSILRKHWPNIPIFKDVRGLHATDIPEPVDLICGGYPCQPFSVAGQRKGKKDDRHLWPEIMRLIQELDAAGNKPAWCLFENVAGHVSMGLDTVLSDLEGEGYTCWPVIIPACGVNAPHRRDRVWIIAHADSAGREERDTAAKSGDKRHTAGGGVERLATDATRQLPHRPGNFWPAGRDKLTDGCDLRRIWIRTTESPVCSRDDGVSGRVARLKALGNAVVPQIPEMIGRAIMAVVRGT